MPEVGIENSNGQELQAAQARESLIVDAQALSRWGLPRAAVEDCVDDEASFAEAPMVLGPVRLAKAIKSRALLALQELMPTHAEYISQGALSEMLYDELLKDTNTEAETPYPLSCNLAQLLPDKTTRSFFAFKCTEFGSNVTPDSAENQAIVRKREQIIDTLLWPENITSLEDGAIEVCLEAGEELGRPGLLMALNELVYTRGSANPQHWTRMWYVATVLHNLERGGVGMPTDQYLLRLPAELCFMPRAQQLRTISRLQNINVSFAQRTMDSLGITEDKLPNRDAVGYEPPSQRAEETLKDIVDLQNPLATLIADDIDRLLQGNEVPAFLIDFGVTETGEAGLQQLKLNLLNLRGEIASGAFDASTLLGVSRQIVAECVFLSARDESYGFLRPAAEKYQRLYRR